MLDIVLGFVQPPNKNLMGEGVEGGYGLSSKTLTFAHARAKKFLNVILVKSKDVFCVSGAVLSDLELF